MAFLAATDITVTVNPEDIDRSPDGRIGMRTFPTVAFGNGVLQYSALGIPMPALGKFGFHFAIKRAYIEQPGNGFIYSFDRANHKLRIFLGAARDAITLAAISAGTPSGNVGNSANVSAGTPAGNVANTANVSGGTPTGNVAAPANHVGVAPTGNVASHLHVENVDANYTANANTGNAAPAFTGDAPANLAHDTPAFTGDALTAHLHAAGAFSGDAMTAHLHAGGAFTGDALASHNHTVTGGGAVAEAALAEMDSGVAPAATTLYMEMVGR